MLAPSRLQRLQQMLPLGRTIADMKDNFKENKDIVDLTFSPVLTICHGLGVSWWN
jgi:hypothetical protein